MTSESHGSALRAAKNCTYGHPYFLHEPVSRWYFTLLPLFYTVLSPKRVKRPTFVTKIIDREKKEVYNVCIFLKEVNKNDAA